MLLYNQENFREGNRNVPKSGTAELEENTRKHFICHRKSSIIKPDTEEGRGIHEKE